MYTVGITKNNLRKALINPKTCPTVQDLQTWLNTFLDREHLKFEKVTVEGLMDSLQHQKAIRQNIEGLEFSIVFGESSVVETYSERYVHIIGLNLLEATIEEIEEKLEKVVA